MARPRGEVPPHGDRKRYQHRSEPCHCGACSEANARYVAGRRALKSLLSRPWVEQQLPPELLPRPAVVGCTHHLMYDVPRSHCSWCGAELPALAAA